VRNRPSAERPRERLLGQGAQSLSEAELLAVFLRIGLPGPSVLDLARDAIALRLAGRPAERPRRRDPGDAGLRAGQVRPVAGGDRTGEAGTEEGRAPPPPVLLDSPPKVRDYLQLRIGRLPQEVFAALFLDAQNRLIDDEELFRGTLTQTSVYPREVAKRALARNAAAVIFAHNHPSGLAEPSRADELLTSTLRDAPGAGRGAGARPCHRRRCLERVVRRAGAALGSAVRRTAARRSTGTRSRRPVYLRAFVQPAPLRGDRWPWRQSRIQFEETAMARVCQVTGKKPLVGNNVSHANNKTKRRFLPNLQDRRFWVESEKRWVRLRLTNAGLRTIEKQGIDAVLADLRGRGEI